MIASDHANKANQAESEFIKGFVLIEKQLQTTLEKLNVTKIDLKIEPLILIFIKQLVKKSKTMLNLGLWLRMCNQDLS